MKRILQAMDGVATKPVVGASDMSRFLRVVKEADLNQLEAVGEFAADPKQQAVMFLQYHTGMFDPATLPKVMGITPNLQLAVQPPPPGSSGSHEETLAYLSAANKKLPKELQVSWEELKKIGGVSDTIALTGEPHPDKYNPATDPVQDEDTVSPRFMGYQKTQHDNGDTTDDYDEGPLRVTQRHDAKGNVVSNKISSDLGVGKATVGQENGITSKEWQPNDPDGDVISTKDMYAMGNKSKEATYNRAMAQVKNSSVQENNLSKFLSIVKQHDVKVLNEGTSPHKVTLPVQMAMQHYSKPVKEERVKGPSLIGPYMKLVESRVTETEEQRKQSIQKKAKQVAERVLNKKVKEVTDTSMRPPAESPAVQGIGAAGVAYVGKLAQQFALANKIDIPPAIMKKIIDRALIKAFPGLNVGFSALDAVDRIFNDHDYLGAAMAMVSGIVGIEPGPGTVAAIILDVTNQIRDYRDKRGLFAAGGMLNPETPTKSVEPKYPKQDFNTTPGGAATGYPNATNRAKSIQETKKKKGADGKACWKGYKYAGTKNGKDKCIPVNEGDEQ